MGVRATAFHQDSAVQRQLGGEWVYAGNAPLLPTGVHVNEACLIFMLCVLLCALDRRHVANASGVNWNAGRTKYAADS
jgi:hypothetical protein